MATLATTLITNNLSGYITGYKCLASGYIVDGQILKCQHLVLRLRFPAYFVLFFRQISEKVTPSFIKYLAGRLWVVFLFFAVTSVSADTVIDAPADTFVKIRPGTLKHVPTNIIFKVLNVIQLTPTAVPTNDIMGSLGRPPSPQDLLLYLSSTNVDIINTAYAKLVHNGSWVDDPSICENHLLFVRLISLTYLRQIVNPDSLAIGLAMSLLRDSNEKVRSAAGDTLKELTGQPIPKDQINQWEEWWAENKAAYVLLYRARELQWVPHNGLNYHSRGCINYDLEFFTNALADFHEACRLGSDAIDYSHFRLWLIRARLGEQNVATQELAEYLSHRARNPDDWPAKIARFLIGQMTEADLLNAAAIPDTESPNGQHCEAYFYIGSKKLMEGNKTEAAEDFKKCLATGMPGFEEYQSAQAGLFFLSSSKTNVMNLHSGGDGLHLVMDPGWGFNHSWSDVGGYMGSAYRASFYMGKGWNFSKLAKTNRTGIFFSPDKKIMVAMVCNNGPIYETANSGLTWEVHSLPGYYRFRLTGDETGGGFLATATIFPQPREELANLSDPSPYRQDGSYKKDNSDKTDFYVVTVAPNGSKFILSSSCPTLSIVKTGAAVIVSWPASFTGFVLQENTDITTANWTDVTNEVKVVGDENQVTLSPQSVNDFFRLKSTN